MIDKDDGGHAFPADASTNLFSRGMTLRDYFAGQAMTVLVQAHVDGINDLSKPDIGREAYGYAAAMLEARKS